MAINKHQLAVITSQIKNIQHNRSSLCVRQPRPWVIVWWASYHRHSTVSAIVHALAGPMCSKDQSWSNSDVWPAPYSSTSTAGCQCITVDNDLTTCARCCSFFTVHISGDIRLMVQWAWPVWASTQPCKTVILDWTSSSSLYWRTNARDINYFPPLLSTLYISDTLR